MHSFSVFFLYVILLFSAACSPSKHIKQVPISHHQNLITAKVFCIDNAMPMTTSGSYLIVNLCSSLPMEENLKLSKVHAKGPKGTWETTRFDFDVFYGKGTDFHENIARKFDLSIGLPVEFELIFQTEDARKEVHFFDTLRKVQTVY